ncbi:MAG: dihydrolipoyllysine-residue acetyltransferase, partial [Bdellovibrionales bacterium]
KTRLQRIYTEHSRRIEGNMAIDIKLPELGEGVTEGELLKWLVKPGDTVKADQAIAEIMTDKATVEVPSPTVGTVKELKYKVGDIVKVESVMITLEGGTSSATAAPKPAPASTNKPSPATAAPVSTTSASGSINVKLPELGEGVTEGELVKWLVKPGDVVKVDQAVVEIMTDKATVEVPSTSAGTVTELMYKVGDIVKVESTILKLAGSVAPTQAAIHETAKSPAPAATTPVSTAKPLNPAGAVQAGPILYPPPADFRVLATPSTRRLAREMGIDLNGMTGTGLAGRVTRDDVLNAKGSRPVASSSAASMSTPKPSYSSNQGAMEERVPLVGVRKKIAENLQKAKQIIPHFTLMDEADVTDLVGFREAMKEAAEKSKTKVTYLPFVMKALIATVREFTMFNASIDDAAGEIVYKKYFNLGFAADTPNGLLVPVIKDADKKSILDISKEIVDLSTRARDGKLKLDEMKGATITITNIGSVGGTYATPVINHPEVAILGMYKISDKLVLGENGQIKVRKVMNFTITCDHRLIDGAVAARFLKAFINRIQNPGVLMLDMH